VNKNLIESVCLLIKLIIETDTCLCYTTREVTYQNQRKNLILASLV